MEVSDEVLEADSAAAEELAGVLLADGDLSEESDGDNEGGESEGSELIAEDQGVEMALEASWLATLRLVGLAPEGGGEGAESGGGDEGGAAAGDESDSDSSLGLGLE
jgi:hypothetical protein